MDPYRIIKFIFICKLSILYIKVTEIVAYEVKKLSQYKVYSCFSYSA